MSHKYLLCNQSAMQHNVVANQDHIKCLTGRMKLILYTSVAQTGERRASGQTTAAGSNLFLPNPASSLEIGYFIWHYLVLHWNLTRLVRHPLAFGDPGLVLISLKFSDKIKFPLSFVIWGHATWHTASPYIGNNCASCNNLNAMENIIRSLWRMHLLYRSNSTILKRFPCENAFSCATHVSATDI